MGFKDKIVLITGASRGIGRTTAISFGKEGATVIVNYLNSEDKATKVVDTINKIGGKAIKYKCDISIEKDVENMMKFLIEEFGKIDILINNAAISNSIPLLERTSEEWQKTMNINLLGTFLCSKYAIFNMKQKGAGKIINLSSINGTKHFYPEQIDYDVSKAGIISMTKILAKFSGPEVSVNAIAPGNIDNYDEQAPTGDPTEEELDKVYLRRHGKIIEIAKVILFLAGDSSSYINGTTIFLDGGCD